ncbi:hypothetical protein C1646_774698 [Rhizophagus diaphanus]|nr:hypothetical protein C1646_774698 [Rhizophagus diaphanus] [Rhizophagus sp. MUCL 43196]
MELCKRIFHLYKDIPYRNHTFSWINLYNQYLVQINDDPNDLIGPAVDDIQEVDGNDSDEEDDNTPQEAYEF